MPWTFLKCNLGFSYTTYMKIYVNFLSVLNLKVSPGNFKKHKNFLLSDEWLMKLRNSDSIQSNLKGFKLIFFFSWNGQILYNNGVYVHCASLKIILTELLLCSASELHWVCLVAVKLRLNSNVLRRIQEKLPKLSNKELLLARCSLAHAWCSPNYWENQHG